ncbi:MAG: GNAT family N-acetyltransferase [Armatimonadetes bacterium]|nr:GNAT family N-acetyltransferase [Armatimonadota bacterium]
MDGLELTWDRDRMDESLVLEWLRVSYWASHRPEETARRSWDRSLCLSAFLGQDQVGFARVITDGATHAWICDVMVHPDHRGQGIGKALMRACLDHEEVSGLRLVTLGTKDAHTLYEQFGFTSENRLMALRRPENPDGSYGC